MSTEPVYSHGRGGQGNIGPDNTEYVDGEIRREEDPTASGGAYSTGRGGAANIGSPRVTPVKTSKHDDDIIPEAAMVKPDDKYHAGRGGEGNAFVGGERVEEKKNTHNGLADKLKKRLSAIMAKFK
ncbi:hypothetical protein BZA05DRAFT_409534 [Tricharina praecox]|uniref:uncharacterized protein n=1 Tax=Tricharina praecox TaxID=43433 RepID=UPI002220F6F4|nr:uncharacterized protein BZA05DRAFT_409534 [Tricharina praecox]KAI5844253.1 hypothetical protein BZA05DRAFT_409534 [Tricharina praecox]